MSRPSSESSNRSTKQLKSLQEKESERRWVLQHRQLLGSEDTEREFILEAWVIDRERVRFHKRALKKTSELLAKHAEKAEQHMSRHIALLQTVAGYLNITDRVIRCPREEKVTRQKIRMEYQRSFLELFCLHIRDLEAVEENRRRFVLFEQYRDEGLFYDILYLTVEAEPRPRRKIIERHREKLETIKKEQKIEERAILNKEQRMRVELQEKEFRTPILQGYESSIPCWERDLLDHRRYASLRALSRWQSQLVLEFFEQREKLHEEICEEIFVHWLHGCEELEAAERAEMEFEMLEEAWYDCSDEKFDIELLQVEEEHQREQECILSEEKEEIDAFHQEFLEVRDAIQKTASAGTIQRIGRGFFERQLCFIERCRIETEKKVAREMEVNQAVTVCQSALRSSLSLLLHDYLVAISCLRHISAVCAGYTERKKCGVDHHAKLSHARKTLQKAGRGFLFRDSLGCDYHVECERRRVDFEKRTLAAQQIQWAYRQHYAHTYTKRRRQIALLHSIQLVASIRIQCAYRQHAARRVFRERGAERQRRRWMQVQRVCRGGYVRNTIRLQRDAVITQAYVRGKLSLVLEFLKRRDAPVRVLQRAARRIFAINHRDLAISRKELSIETRQKHNAATLFQSLYRMIICRRAYLRTRERLHRESIDLLETSTRSYVPMIQRLGKGYAERQRLGRNFSTVNRRVATISAHMRYYTSVAVVNQLCETLQTRIETYITNTAIILVQSSLRAFLAHRETVQMCKERGEAHVLSTRSARMLQRIGRAFIPRLEFATKRQETLHSLRVLHGFWRCVLARRRTKELRITEAHQKQLKREMCARLQLQLWWRQLYIRKMRVAGRIQLFFLRKRESVRRRREFREARAGVIRCKTRKLCREEEMERRTIRLDEDKLFERQKYIFVEKRKQLLVREGEDCMEIELAYEFMETEEEGRLQVKKDENSERQDLKSHEEASRKTAEEATQQRLFSSSQGNIMTNEGIIRARYLTKELVERRAISLWLREAITGYFSEKLSLIESEEEKDRETNEIERSGWFERNMKQAVKLQILALEQIVEAAAKDAVAPKEPEEEVEEVPSGPTRRNTIQPRLAPLRMISHLRAFAVAQSSTFVDMTPEEMESLLHPMPPPLVEDGEGKKEVPSPSSREADIADPKSSQVSLTSTPQGQRKVTTTGPPSISPVGTPSASIRMFESTPKKLPISSDGNGFAMASNLNLVDENMKDFCEDCSCMGLLHGVDVSSNDLTDKGLSEIICFFETKKYPIDIFNIARNPRISDIGGLQLAHYVAHTPSLCAAIDLEGTSISTAKRQLIEHLLAVNKEKKVGAACTHKSVHKGAASEQNTTASGSSSPAQQHTTIPLAREKEEKQEDHHHQRSDEGMMQRKTLSELRPKPLVFPRRSDWGGSGPTRRNFYPAHPIKEKKQK